MNKIENLQKKPEYLRRKILIVSVFVSMFIIVSVWVSTINLSMSGNEKTQEASSPFAVFGDIIKDGYNISAGILKDGWGQIEKVYAE